MRVGGREWEAQSAIKSRRSAGVVAMYANSDARMAPRCRKSLHKLGLQGYALSFPTPVLQSLADATKAAFRHAPRFFDELFDRVVTVSARVDCHRNAYRTTDDDFSASRQSETTHHRARCRTRMCARARLRERLILRITTCSDPTGEHQSQWRNTPMSPRRPPGRSITVYPMR